MLEFVHSMQSESHRPELLFDELENSHLLILGSGFPDWLARFLLRTAKRRRLSDPRDVTEVVAEDGGPAGLAADPLPRLVQQPDADLPGRRVRSSSPNWPRVGRSGTRRPTPATRYAGRRCRDTTATAPVGDMPANAVFLSYAKEDFQSVLRLKADLEGAGIGWCGSTRKNWRRGDEFDLKIQRHIRDCSFFVPIISRQTDARRRGFFRREWNYALDRAAWTSTRPIPSSCRWSWMTRRSPARWCPMRSAACTGRGCRAARRARR